MVEPKMIHRFLFTLSVFAFSLSAQQNAHVWSDYGGSPDNSHYSASTQITRQNVNQLKVAWSYPTGDNAGYLFNPLVVNNVAYVMARNNSLVAIDATTGRELWIHENLQGIAGRGINYWESKDHKDKRLIFQIHNQLQAIDAATGKSILSFGTNGFVDLREGLRGPAEEINRIQSGTPGKIFENLVILGSATGENFISPPGDLRAYDVLTGKLAWQFHTVPHPGETGYDTWPKDAWKYAGGVNTWGELSIDEKRGIAFFPLGSSTFDFYGADRAGNDLFANCILALDARTGKYKWHFQEVHHDLWDYDLVSAPQLITVKVNGKTIDAVAQAGKTGFLYVLDRVTGKPVWPIEERPVPKSDMPGEHASPTQPFPTRPPAFSLQKFNADDVNPLLPAEARANLRDRVSSARNEGLFTPPTTKDTIEMPGNRGGSNWGTTAANPAKGIVYVLSIDAPSILKLGKMQPTGNGGIGGAAAYLENLAGPQIYEQNYAACHGADRKGQGSAPSLLDITARMGTDVIETTLRNGQGQMPPFSFSEHEMEAVIRFLGTGVGFVAPGGRGGPAVASRPDASLVAGTGGAPAGQTAYASRKQLPNWGPMEGPAYPEGVDAPKERFFTGWNVLYDAVKGPWNKLTAYDLNKGDIKWQIPLADLQTEQRGVIATATGLVFVATGDGKVRAFDEDNGKLLWTGDLPAGSRSIPAMYEANGKQYLLISATQVVQGSTGPGVVPRQYVAFALP
jgi:quinoprotein glucose dehydrogenase